MQNPTFDNDECVPPNAGTGGIYSEKVVVEKNGGNVEIVEKGATLEMPRKVGLMSGIALIVGTMIGSGIFVSPGGLLRQTDSVGVALIIWVACGVFSLLGALVYADLGTMIPKSGGEYSYFLEAWGAKHAFFGPLPAFLFSWITVLLLRPSGFAILVLSFAEYTVNPIAEAIDPKYAHSEDYAHSKNMITKSVAVFCLILVTAVNCFSTKFATKVQNVFTAAKLFAMIIIVAGGIYYTAAVNSSVVVNNLQWNVSPNTSWGSIATAFYSGLWAYDGWNNLNFVTEELKNPNVNLLRSIVIGLPLVTVAYLLVNISYLTALTPEVIKATVGVATAWGKEVLGPAWVLMPIAVAVSTFGGANGGCFAGGRLNYVAGREGHLPEIFSFVHVKYLTPVPGLLFSASLALLMVVAGDILDLIDFFAFTALIFYGMAMVVHIMLSCSGQAKEVSRPVPVSIVVSIIVMLCCIFLVVVPIVQDPQWAYLYVLLFLAGGVIVYVPCVYCLANFPPCCEQWTNHVTSFLKRALRVGPCNSEKDLG